MNKESILTKSDSLLVIARHFNLSLNKAELIDFLEEATYSVDFCIDKFKFINKLIYWMLGGDDDESTLYKKEILEITSTARKLYLFNIEMKNTTAREWEIEKNKANSIKIQSEKELITESESLLLIAKTHKIYWLNLMIEWALAIGYWNAVSENYFEKEGAMENSGFYTGNAVCFSVGIVQMSYPFLNVIYFASIIEQIEQAKTIENKKIKKALDASNELTNEMLDKIIPKKIDAIASQEVTNKCRLFVSKFIELLHES